MVCFAYVYLSLAKIIQKNNLLAISLLYNRLMCFFFQLSSTDSMDTTETHAEPTIDYGIFWHVISIASLLIYIQACMIVKFERWVRMP